MLDIELLGAQPPQQGLLGAIVRVVAPADVGKVAGREPNSARGLLPPEKRAGPALYFLPQVSEPPVGHGPVRRSDQQGVPLLLRWRQVAEQPALPQPAGGKDHPLRAKAL